MAKMKKPGRVKLICMKCEDEFKTHSSNRKVCHKCKPKCTEKHYFFAADMRKTAEKEGKLKQSIELNVEQVEKVEAVDSVVKEN